MTDLILRQENINFLMVFLLSLTNNPTHSQYSYISYIILYAGCVLTAQFYSLLHIYADDLKV
jgi:hypothetical protein